MNALQRNDMWPYAILANDNLRSLCATSDNDLAFVDPICFDTCQIFAYAAPPCHGLPNSDP
jgi:hypothetical protein